MLDPLRALPPFPQRGGEGQSPWFGRVLCPRATRTDASTREPIADLLNKVEIEGRWASNLPAPWGLCYPKGTYDPMNRRPTCVMPTIYRMWAGHRASAWAKWRLT